MGQEASRTIHVGAHNIDKEINKNGGDGGGSTIQSGGGSDTGRRGATRTQPKPTVEGANVRGGSGTNTGKRGITRLPGGGLPLPAPPRRP